MKASLLLVAALLFLCGLSFFRQARLRTGTASQSLFLAIFSWFLSAVFAVIAVLAIAHPTH